MSLRGMSASTLGSRPRRRPVISSAARRRRTIAVDVVAGLALAGIALALVPGLALVGAGSLLLLIACGGWTLAARLRSRRRSRRRAAR
jgi:ABC-type Na+ efflux pump permease subunit